MLSSLFLSSRPPMAIISSSSSSSSSSLNADQNPSNPTRHPHLEHIRKGSRFSVPREPTRNPGEAIKVPTAPWMRGPLLLRPDEVLDASEPRKKSKGLKVEEKTFKALNRRESGVRGKKAMKKIVRNIEKLQVNSDSDESQMDYDYQGELGSGKWEDPAVLGVGERFGGKMPWNREEERFILRRAKKEKVATMAELSLDEDLLKRLRRDAVRMRKWVKVKKAGVTEAVVNEIRLIWRKNELAMVKFDVPLCRNMDRAQEIVEVWLVNS